MFPRLIKNPCLLASLLSAVVLVGCEAPATKPDPGAYTTGKSTIQQLDDKVARANNLPSPEREIALLQAAEDYLARGSTRSAETIVKSLDTSRLPAELATRYTLLQAEVALATERYYAARELLQNEALATNIAGSAADLRKRWHRARAELYTLLGDDAKSIYEHARLARLVRDPALARQIHDQIWQALSHLSDEELGRAAVQSADDDIRGWYQLALDTRGSQGDIALQVEKVNAWRRLNPQHPGALLLPTSLQQAAQISDTLPRQVAVLLPGGGEYRLAGQTVRDGILAAYYEVMASGGSVPSLRFYDTDQGGIETLYQRAAMEGADLVLGPLRREQLSSLMVLSAMPIPVLGLNYIEESANPQKSLYQFGLSIRDEAEQVADRAWVAGHRSALAITPSTSWGDSALDAFRQAWLKKGGTIAATNRYNTDQKDYSELLEPTFLVQHSRERARRIERTLGKNVAFTPRRRSDIDMIFLIAYPQNGRQIKPTLDFLYAGDLPVMATSHIYAGTANPALDRDLDGISFTAMPWAIKALSSGSIKPDADLPSAYRNLFAMGVDAYRLHQWLELLASQPDAEIHGYTGSLSLAQDNHIARKQPWATFRNGKAVPAPLLAED